VEILRKLAAISCLDASGGDTEFLLRGLLHYQAGRNELVARGCFIMPGSNHKFHTHTGSWTKRNNISHSVSVSQSAVDSRQSVSQLKLVRKYGYLFWLSRTKDCKGYIHGVRMGGASCC